MEERFEQILEHANEFYFLFNIKDNKIEYANTAFSHITKRDFETYKNAPALLYEMIHPDDKEYVKRMLKEFLEHQKFSLLDFRIMWPNKTERWIRFKIYPDTQDKKMQYVGGVLEDDSARKAIIFNMQRINAWKNSTLEILAHDLNGEIGTIQMIVHDINTNLSEGANKEILEWTSIINTICQRNINLIRNLLKKESLTVEGIKLNLERINIVAEVNEIITTYIAAQYELRKKFEFTYSHKKIFAEVDCTKFGQIINNLISNAIKFTPEHAIIKLHIERLEETFLVTISDAGIGIPKRLQPYLFLKYTSAKRPGINGKESTGLGLWIVKLFTELHHGRIWVESEENKGTTFYIEIPFTIKKN